ncbi:malto-oligosyltrehalose synthase [Marinobacter salinus]|uniref:malto-oligosyltrehalose synthase n=1 Tax=Marinobacter salinus TaxID=1874317 RepID=UPI0009F61D4D|nr:malto-oligosyltrehalose synthase [Marinobacter salinus]
MRAPVAPSATYRLQFNRDFTFAAATKIIPYLHLLGISHIYASPFLKARAGSPHGYDIVDHNALDPELGDEASFATYVQALQEHGMSQILDIVPNHMGVGGDDNAWWLDVLENGESSAYARYFDIDWHPANPALRNKVLLPFLGDHYGATLEQGELTLVLNADEGTFGVRYYEHLFPVDPRSYPQILSFGIELLEHQLSRDPQVFSSFTALIADCHALPRRTELASTRRTKRTRGIAACKGHLTELYRHYPEIRAHINRNLRHFNGTLGQPESFDPLDRLLEKQAYRLAYWQVASDEINYRRFFDINELAGIRIEDDDVFSATHRLVQRLIDNGEISGLRIDHPDGLSDPFKYYGDLQAMIASTLDAKVQEPTEANYYVLVEKVLTYPEHLPVEWPVSGTTGYEAAHLLNGLLICPDSEHALSRFYRQFTGQSDDFSELLYKRKKLIIHGALASDLTSLAKLASSIAQTDRHTRDFTYQALRAATAEIAACFPVYRTYITRERSSETDYHYIRQAITQAKKRSPANDIQIFDFLEELITLGEVNRYSPRIRQEVVRFALRFQQYTAPVMAKGLEDTALYSYNRLVSMNDVGFDPRAFGVSVDTFHQENQRRLSAWPQSMVTTSTHDSKRSEDVRTRINILSELPREWRQHVSRWSRMNRHKKRLVNDIPMPSRNDEYLLYQILLGAWPPGTTPESDLAGIRGRIEAYMLKAVREAKVFTSWINPNPEYESAMQLFVRALLDNSRNNEFLKDFIPFQQRLGWFGLLSSLSQTLLKLTIPGVPDIYQGNDLCAFNLVDPDNRAPVDFHRRQRALQALTTEYRNNSDPRALLQDLLTQIEDGRAKLFLTWRTLTLRRQQYSLFIEGEYFELKTRGHRANHICAFGRRLGDKEVIVAVPRWFARLTDGNDSMPLGSPTWDDTWIEAGGDASTGSFHNVLTDEVPQVSRNDNGLWFRAADLFRYFPVALLTRNCAPL